MLDNIKVWLKDNWLKVVIGIVVVILAGYLLSTFKSPEQAAKKVLSPTIITQESQVTVTPKRTLEDPDLVLTNNYTAEVDGQTLKIPLKTSKDNTTATVTQKIDLTEVVSALRKQDSKSWEVGMGGGSKGGAVSLQRNYDRSHGVEVMYTTQEDVYVMWKVRF